MAGNHRARPTAIVGRNPIPVENYTDGRLEGTVGGLPCYDHSGVDTAHLSNSGILCCISRPSDKLECVMFMSSEAIRTIRLVLKLRRIESDCVWHGHRRPSLRLAPPSRRFLADGCCFQEKEKKRREKKRAEQQALQERMQVSASDRVPPSLRCLCLGL